MSAASPLPPLFIPEEGSENAVQSEQAERALFQPRGSLKGMHSL